MSNTGASRPTLWRRFVSESESDPMNSTINLRGNPRIYITSERAKSNPNISGFVDESLYMGPGTHLQSQLEGIEMRTEHFLNLFHRLQRDIDEWESSIRNENYPSTAIEINQRFASFTKAVENLTNQVVSIKIHRDISTLGDVVAQIKRLGLRNVNSWIGQPVLEGINQVESSSALGTNLSVTAPPFNGVLGVIEVQSQNLYGSEPSTDCTFEGGNMKLIQAPPVNVLQIRNQNLYGSESSIDHLYGGDNPHSSTLFKNRITEVQESCLGSESNINYDEG